jgi:uncharacterized membrane protein
MALRFPLDAKTHRHPANIRHMGADRTVGERVADWVASLVGSWPFIIVQSTLLMLWIVVNVVVIRDWLHGKPFDPYPFILLNLMLSFQAAYTGPVVLMSQNREAARDRDEAEHDYAVNKEALELLKEVREEQRQLRDSVANTMGGSG